MNPPVSAAIQGAYFVGVLMSGLIFGGGALIFKEVTEGLGCLLGGFCLSMWFLTLKSGGLVTSGSGKAIFITVFCVICWSLSFSHYTRAYGLIFSTSFAGSTAFVLGIDCFSRGGLKEFWVYLWNLNNDIFPLNTTTYPITRGIRVETVIVVIGTIIGVVSQLRLWKVVQDRRKQRADAEAEDVKRRDAVEEALGRHLERQIDRDRSEWEKRYGDRLSSKRSTAQWSDGRGDKGFPSTSTTEVDSSHNSDSNDSLEMSPLPAAVVKSSLHSSKSKRQSNISVQAIPEAEEEDHRILEKRDRKHSSAVDRKSGDSLPPSLGKVSFDQNGQAGLTTNELNKTTSKESQVQFDVPQSLRPQNAKPTSSKTSARLQSEAEDTSAKDHSSMPSSNDFKRRSLQSLRSKGPPDPDKPSGEVGFSESTEALVVPAAATNYETHSRASSVAATLDEENEKLELPAFEVHDSLQREGRPQIVMSSLQGIDFLEQMRSSLPPSPSGLSDQFDVDPEELVRPPAIKAAEFMGASGGYPGEKSIAGASNTSGGEGLTKGALEQVPSQLSNVVLSYRTNEWAKHIATAEAPFFEEPDPVVLSDAEAPTHLADPAMEAKKVEIIEKPPVLPSPVTSVAPSESGVRINPEIQPAEKSKTSLVPEKETSTQVSSLPSPNPESIMSSPALNGDMPSPAPDTLTQPQSQMAGSRRSFTDPAQQVSTMPKSIRRISNTSQKQPSALQSTPIHENYATTFAPQATGPMRFPSNANGRMTQNQFGPSPAIDVAQSQQYPSAFKRSSSMMTHQNRSQPEIRPSTSYASADNAQGLAAMWSDTRLGQAGTRTHQPLHRNNTNDSRRESLMADWRTQLANSNFTPTAPQNVVDNRYAQQILDWETERLRREQDQHERARKEAMMDQSMRTQGMIEAHREVMRKMQNQANQKIK